MEAVTIIIPHYLQNSKATMLSFLPPLVVCAMEGDDKVLIVANGGTFNDYENLRECAEGISERIKVIYAPVSNSYSARNFGVRYVTTPLVAFLDDDVTPAPDWLHQTKKFLADNPIIQYVGGKTIFGSVEEKLSFITCNVSARTGLLKTYSYESVYSGADLKFERHIRSHGVPTALNSLAVVYHDKEGIGMRTKKTLRYGSGTTIKTLVTSYKKLILDGYLLLVKTLGYVVYALTNKMIGKR